MNPKIIDFSNGTKIPRVLVINPTFLITNRNIEIEFKDGNVPTFSIHVGCRTTNVTADNIQRILKELNGEEMPVVPTKVIVLKGGNAKSSCPKLKEEAGDWFISSIQKAFHKDEYEIQTINIKEKRRWFSPNNRGWNKTNYPICYKGGYEMSKKDIENTKSILIKLKDFFEVE